MIERRARRPRMGGLIGLQNFLAGPRPRRMLRQGDAGERCEDEEDDQNPDLNIGQEIDIELNSIQVLK